MTQSVLNLLITLFLICGSTQLFGQGVDLLHDSRAVMIMDRLAIKSGKYITPPFHSNVKAWTRQDAVELATKMLNDSTLTDGDKADIRYILTDNSEISFDIKEKVVGTVEYKKQYVDDEQLFYTLESNTTVDTVVEAIEYGKRKPIFKLFYHSTGNFLQVDKPNFNLRVNPIIDFRVGKDLDDTGLLFKNTRGFRLRGNIANKIGFYTSIQENQERLPTYLEDRTNTFNALPGAGFIKNYNSSIFDITDGFDYLTAQGYVTFPVTDFVRVQLGHGEHFVGDGIRSLILSDDGADYFYLKLRTRVWLLEYQNLFAEISGRSNPFAVDRLVPKKYMAQHHLNFRPHPNVRFGIFETVIFSRNQGFELQYLNPLILYRTIEGSLGSPDNVLAGADFTINIKRKGQIYGQFVLDEFLFKELLVERRGWWANKLGFQVGAKYIDAFGVDHLDLQAELNIVRPYTYSHRDSTASFTHYNQILAHPLGANFAEALARVRYQPIPKLTLNASVTAARYGQDSLGSNWGSNILLENTSREQNFGNEIGQGVTTNLLHARFLASYELYHNFYIEAEAALRRQDAEIDSYDNTMKYFGLGIRWNIAPRTFDF